MIVSGDVELASMAAGLVVEKAGDTLSVSDSALGESSVISGTTAGVTQFSEVSQIGWFATNIAATLSLHLSFTAHDVSLGHTF